MLNILSKNMFIPSLILTAIVQHGNHWKPLTKILPGSCASWVGSCGSPTISLSPVSTMLQQDKSSESGRYSTMSLSPVSTMLQQAKSSESGRYSTMSLSPVSIILQQEKRKKLNQVDTSLCLCHLQHLCCSKTSSQNQVAVLQTFKKAFIYKKNCLVYKKFILKDWFM